MNVVDPKMLKGMIQYNEEVKVKLEAEAAQKAADKEAAPVATGKAKAKKKTQPPPKLVPAPIGAGSAETTGVGIRASGDSGSVSAANVVRKAAPSTEQVLLGDSAAASSSAMTETPPDDNVEWRGLIEICTSPDSVLGRKTRFQKGCRVTRVTREVNFTKPKG